MKIMYYSAVLHEKTKRHLNKRFSNAPPVKNIQNGQAFIVEGNKTLNVMRYSGAKTVLSTMQY